MLNQNQIATLVLSCALCFAGCANGNTGSIGTAQADEAGFSGGSWQSILSAAKHDTQSASVRFADAQRLYAQARELKARGDFEGEQKALDDAAAAEAEAQALLNKARAARSLAYQQLAEAQARRDSLAGNVAAQQGQIQSQINSTQTDINNLKKDLDSLNSQVSSLEAQLAALQAQLNQT